MQFARIAVFYNPNKPENAPLAERVCAFLRAQGAAADVLTDLTPLGAYNLLISMGGDGTILHCARTAAPVQVPIFGINCGTLGFLAAAEKNNLETDLTQLLRGGCTLNRRMMLAAKVHGETFTAFNDCVLRTDEPRAFVTRAVWNGKDLPSYYGDGIIVATPTGSTAYSLAAGGPIIEPSMPVLAITPVCPHSLYQRPLVLPADGVLTLTPDEKITGNAFVSLDGQNNASVPHGQSVTLTRAPFDALLLSLPQRHFFSLLHRKLSWGR